jgi:hypothetical protein
MSTITTITLNGTITGPTGADVSINTFGYDNADFFGTSFANLAGTPWLLTWTGTDCNCNGVPGIDAVLTVNGISVDLGAYNNITQSEWLDRNVYTGGPGTFIQMETTFLSPPNFYTAAAPSSQYILATQITGNSVTGVVYLGDSAHLYETNFFINGQVGVPGPVLGAGLPGLLLLAILMAWKRK